MASPRTQVFALYDSGTGAIITNATIANPAGVHFTTYKDSLGNAVATPDISNLGDGLYGFTPNFPVNPDLGVLFVIETKQSPAYYAGYIRPEDYATEELTTDVGTLSSDVDDISIKVNKICNLLGI